MGGMTRPALTRSSATVSGCRGYRGSVLPVRRYLAGLRTGTAPPARADIPSPPKISSWIMQPCDRLTAKEEEKLLAVRLSCTVNCCRTGSARPNGTHLPPSVPSPASSARTLPPSPPVSPCRGAPASSKATSTASKQSREACTAEPRSDSSGSVSSPGHELVGAETPSAYRSTSLISRTGFLFG